jgi:hypothetical protein
MEACGQDGRGRTWAVAPTRRRRSTVLSVTSSRGNELRFNMPQIRF